MKANKNIQEHVIVILIFLILTFVFTYPLMIKLDTPLRSGGDYYQFLWNLWWFNKAVVDLQQSPFFTDYIFQPYGVSLAFHEPSYFNCIAGIPLQHLFGLVATYHLLIIFSFVVSGWGMYLLVKHLTHHRSAAIISGIIFSFCPYHFIRIGQLNLASIQWIPFFILYWFKTFDDQNYRYSIYAAIFLVLTVLCSWYYFIFLLLFCCFFIVYKLIFQSVKSIFNFSVVKRLMLMAVIFSVILSPLLYVMLKEIFAGKTYMYIEQSAVGISFDLIGNCTQTGNIILWPVLLGYTPLLLGFYGLLKSKESKFWCACFLFFGILSLGPYLHVLGKLYPIPLPYIIIQHLPIIKTARAPDRLLVMMMCCLAVLSAYGIRALSYTLENRLPVRKIFNTIIILLVSILFITYEFLVAPFPECEATTVPEFYQRLAEEKYDDYALFELPFGMYNTFFLFYQIIHQKKITGGFIARIPPWVNEFFDTEPVIELLSHPERIVSTELTPEQKEQYLTKLKQYRFKYVILHKNYIYVPVKPRTYWIRCYFFRDYFVGRQIKTLPPKGCLLSADQMSRLHQFLNSLFNNQKYYEDDELVVYKLTDIYTYSKEKS